MADNVDISPGSGATIAADDIAGVKHQRVKISLGADGSATDLPGDGTNGADVDVTRLPAGEAHLGQLGGSMVEVVKEFTRPADTTAYTAGDMVSDSTIATTMQVLPNVARVNGGSGYITGMRLITDKKSITPRFRVRLFHTAGAGLAIDNDPYKSLYADIAKRVGYVDLPAMSTPADATNSTQSESQDLGLRVPFVCDGGSRDLLYALEALDAFTPASGQKFSLKIVCDLN